MLTQPQVQRFASESNLKDIMIAEKEVVLTFLLQLLSDRGVLAKLAFKGGTCLRKMHLGSQGRFSTDLDFTGIEDHDHEDAILEMMAAFEEPCCGIKFAVPNDGYYEADDKLSWGVNPTYSHQWNKSGESEIKIQVSRRETPTLPLEERAQCEQSYFRSLPFKPTPVKSLALPEILSEKIRATYQRNKARDIYDLSMFATKSLDHAVIRRLIVLKLWQVGDSFNPEKLLTKMADEKQFDYDDLVNLTRHCQGSKAAEIIGRCISGYAFLKALTPSEKTLAKDEHQREHKLWKKLSEEAAAQGTLTP
jgi:predicted nucleotidyltransferase component of viral defense system